jgi:hypothetical protein
MILIVINDLYYALGHSNEVLLLTCGVVIGYLIL